MTDAQVKAGLLRRCTGAVPLTVLLLTAVTAALSAVGGDLRWVAALGRALVAGRDPGRAIPYAVASSSGWPNVPALAEVVLHGARTVAGDRGFLLAQLLAVGGGMSALATDAVRAGARPRAVSVALAMLFVGAASSELFIRLSLFSLLLMPVLLVLLRSEAREPTGRVWLLVPLLTLWSNLHGAVVLGAAVAASYLLLSRARIEPRRTLAVAVAAAIGMLLFTAAGPRTIIYYWRALNNELALQHVGLWARLSLHSPLDVAFLLVATVWAVLIFRGRPAVWEAAALAGLTVLTATAARHGVWLLMVGLAPVSRGLVSATRDPRQRERTISAGARTRPPRVLAAMMLAAVLLLVGSVLRGPIAGGAGRPMLASAQLAAGRGPLQAEAFLGEQLAEAGAQVWIANPLEAFSRGEQRRYVRWVQSGDPALIPAPVTAVLVLRGSACDRHLRADPHFHLLLRDRGSALFVRVVSRDGAAS